MTGQYTREYWQSALDTTALNGRMFINGRFEDAADGTTFVRIRPMDGKPGGTFARGKLADVGRAVAAARAAFESGVWRRKDPAEKKRILLKWADLIRENREELALLETIDVGKPVMASLNVDVALAANCIQYYAELCDKLYDEVAPTGPNDRAIVRKVPLGVIGAITPWNYPLIIDS